MRQAECGKGNSARRWLRAVLCVWSDAGTCCCHPQHTTSCGLARMRRVLGAAGTQEGCTHWLSKRKSVPLAMGSHAWSDCTAWHKWVDTCPTVPCGHARTCTDMQTAVPALDHISACPHLCGCSHSHANTGVQAHTPHKYSPVPSASAHSQVKFLSGVSTLQ